MCDIYGRYSLTLIMMPLGMRIVLLNKGRKIPRSITWQGILDCRQKIPWQIIDIKALILRVWITDEIKLQPKPLIPRYHADFSIRDQIIQRCSEHRKSTTDVEICVSIYSY